MPKILCRFGSGLFTVLGSAALLSAAGLDNSTRQLAHDIFQQLIEINTTDSVGSTTVAANAMRQRLLDGGFSKEDVVVLGPNDRKGNMVVRFRGTGAGAKPILIICHLDVVEARRQDWTTDPFQFVEKNGYFYGRGTQDVKSGDAVLVTDLIRLKQEGFQPNRDIIVALTADEEGGSSNGVDWLLKNHRDLIEAEYVLNPDAGGVLLENGKVEEFFVEATEKLYADFELTARNPGGHSSLPVPDNAIYHIAGALDRLQRFTFPFELNAVTRAYFKASAERKGNAKAADMLAILQTPPDPDSIARLSTDPVNNSTFRTTCVATRLSGGHANNALPQTAQAIVNCRILPGHSPEEVRQTLIKVFADSKIEVAYIDALTETRSLVAPDKKSFAPPPLRPDLMKALQRVVDSIWPGALILPEMEAGASDSIYTMAAGIPSYGVSGIAVDRDDIRAHGKDERLRVESYYAGVQFYYDLLKALTSAP
ncbi:MAG TPA: M20/M25/M40 family metallo-hydrolase [Bryobacteraceae bacterium]|nr:M20/M25/M40 family metallo-hydrolase [Bryobacteraceae bacterium]